MQELFCDSVCLHYGTATFTEMKVLTFPTTARDQFHITCNYFFVNIKRWIRVSLKNIYTVYILASK